MSVGELSVIVVPPPAPVESHGSWPAVEARLGIGLPQDFKDYIEVYGTGCIDEFVWVLNPFSANRHLSFFDRGTAALDALRELQLAHPDVEVRDPLFPAPGGLLPWGLTDNGDVLSWATIGSPDDWSVVINASRDARLERHASGMTRCLARLLTGEVRSHIFPSDFPGPEPAFRVP